MSIGHAQTLISRVSRHCFGGPRLKTTGLDYKRNPLHACKYYNHNTNYKYQIFSLLYINSFTLLLMFVHFISELVDDDSVSFYLDRDIESYSKLVVDTVRQQVIVGAM